MLLKGNEKLMSITKPNDKLLHDATGTILENWDKKYGIHIRGSVNSMLSSTIIHVQLKQISYPIILINEAIG